jgi:hypothetical protein
MISRKRKTQTLQLDDEDDDQPEIPLKKSTNIVSKPKPSTVKLPDFSSGSDEVSLLTCLNSLN